MPDGLNPNFWIDYYRRQIESFIADQKNNPLDILAKVLNVYLIIEMANARPFATTLKKGLTQENYPVLDEIELHLKQNKKNKDKFYWMLAAYFYYYQHYYILSDLTNKTQHKHLHQQLLYPLQLMQQQQQNQLTVKMTSLEKYAYYMLIKDLIESDPKRYSERFVTELIQQIPNGNDFLFYTKYILRALSVADLTHTSFIALVNVLANKTVDLEVLVPLMEKIILKQFPDGPSEKELITLLELPCIYVQKAVSHILLEKQMAYESIALFYQIMALPNHYFYIMQRTGYALLAANLFKQAYLNELGLSRLVDILESAEAYDWQKQEILNLFAKINLPLSIVNRLTPVLADLRHNPSYETAALASLCIARFSHDPTLSQQILANLKQSSNLLLRDLEILKLLKLTAQDSMLFISKLLQTHFPSMAEYECIITLCQNDMVHEWCMQKIFNMLAQGNSTHAWYNAVGLLSVLPIPAQYRERVLMTLKAALYEDIYSGKPAHVCKTLCKLSLPPSEFADIFEQLLLLTTANDRTTRGIAYDTCVYFADSIPTEKINYEQVFNHLATDSVTRTGALAFLLRIQIPAALHFNLIMTLLANFKTLEMKENVCALFIKCPLPRYHKAIIKCLFSEIATQVPAVKNAYYNVIAHMQLVPDDVQLLIEKIRFLNKVSVLDEAALALLCKHPLTEKQKEEVLLNLLDKLPSLTFNVQRMFFKYINYFSAHLSVEQKTIYLIKLGGMTWKGDGPGLAYLYEDYRQKQLISFQLEHEIDKQLQPTLPPEIWAHCNRYVHRP